MRIAIAQVNPVLGDVAHNAALVRRAVSHAAGADLVVFPELVVSGYPPQDLLFDRSFVDQVQVATLDLARHLASGPPVVLGTLTDAPTRRPGHPGLHNAAVLLQDGRVAATVAKQLLPTYDVFHETRWFVPGGPSAPLAIRGHRVGLMLCEDMWDEGYDVHPGASLVHADFIVCLSASPYRAGIHAHRLRQARRLGRPLVYVNAVGGQDALIFDGDSFVLDSSGTLVTRLAQFDEDVKIVDLPKAGPPDASRPIHHEEELLAALVLGLRDFARKNGVRRAFLGLSGGIDSALVACIAQRALGPSAVTAVAMPSRFTDPRSTTSARELADALHIDFEEIPIEPGHAALEALMAPVLGDDGVARENLQARLRATILMAFLNRHGGILLNTSNKTELSLGYGTLYGDLAGDLSVIGDLTKPQVVALARRCPEIPRFILERPPSAELRPDQVDPFDYPRVAPRVEDAIQGRATAPPWESNIARAEHKRWQAPIVLKVSDRSFGSGRLVPITHAYHSPPPPAPPAPSGSPQTLPAQIPAFKLFCEVS